MNLEDIWKNKLGKDSPESHTPRQAVEITLEKSDEIHPIDELQQKIDTFAQILRDVQDELQQLRIKQQDAPRAEDMPYNKGDQISKSETWESIGAEIRKLQPLVIRINTDIKELQEYIAKLSKITGTELSDN